VCIEREQNGVSESIWGAMGGRRKKMLANEKYSNSPTISEYNIICCTVSCQLFREHGGRE
jgi:hypothetical protein